MDKIVFVLLHGSQYFCNRYSNSLIMNRNLLLFFSLCLSLCVVTPSVATSLYGIERMLAVDSLPVLDCGVHVRSTGIGAFTKIAMANGLFSMSREPAAYTIWCNIAI